MINAIVDCFNNLQSFFQSIGDFLRNIISWFQSVFSFFGYVFSNFGGWVSSVARCVPPYVPIIMGSAIVVYIAIRLVKG